MGITDRIHRMEDTARRAPPRRVRRRTHEEWLAEYEGLGREGYFDTEPDFPKALAFYRDALRRAKAKADPPWDPPAAFMPHLADLPDLRVEVWWRDSSRFPEVWEGFSWVGEMRQRVAQGLPAVTEAEFSELAGWLEDNADRLRALEDRSGLLDLGDGRRTTVTHLLGAAEDGPRGPCLLVRGGVGQLAEDLRRLRALAERALHQEGAHEHP
jgi:hypothetical protein